MSSLKIVHFSDILCVWAYLGQSSLQKLSDTFGNRIDVETRFCSVFPDAHKKIGRLWKDRGGFGGYSDHVRAVVDGFEGVALHADVWTRTRPKSSASPHLFVKALELTSVGTASTGFQDSLTFKAVRELRSAFFTEGKDVSDWAVQRRISEKLGADFDEVRGKIETGEAIASLAADYELSQNSNVRGSPTYYLNEGRQILFGNISYGILEANVEGLLAEHQDLNASPC